MVGLFNVKTYFSLGESLVKPGEVVSLAKKVGASSVVVTDTMSVCAMPDILTHAKKEGMKAIIGTRLRIYDKLFRSRDEKKKFRPYHVRVLALSDKGMGAIFNVLSKAFDEDHFYEVPRLLIEDVISAFATCGKEDVVITLGDSASILTTQYADSFVEELQAKTGVDVAVDIVTEDTPYFMRHNFESMRLARKYGLKVFIESPVHYDESSKADSLDVMRCIANNLSFNGMAARDTVTDWVPKGAADTVARSVEVLMKANGRFGDGSVSKDDIKDIVRSSFHYMKEVEDRITYEWKTMPPALPKMTDDDFAALKEECAKGWQTRLGNEVFGYKPTDLTPYRERLVHELKLIKSKNFSAYFLLVAKITKWCSENGIRVGPARGSAGGSLVAYLTGITQVDPIRFNLLFERFINPARHDLPDIDLDFMSSRREEVIKFVEDEFGKDYVAGVSNYTKLLGAGALSDVSKRMGVENVPAFGSWFEKEHGVSETLSEAMEGSPQLERFSKQHPEETRHALALEGTLRSYGKHAAGVIVAGVPISERGVVERRSGASVVCWDKRSCEEFGLIKLDVLGLSNLDMIDITVRHIKNRTGKTINLFGIPLDDPEVLKKFGEGRVVGVFQFASSMMRGILKDMYKSGSISFDDLCAATALGRPGPLDAGMVEDYIKRKNGETPVSYPHYAAEKSMKDTYGVLCYQETIMRVVQDVAGLTPVDAEGVRRAIGKKDHDKMKSYEEQFVKGATAGFADVTLEDGRVVKVHLARQLMCSDGKTRTIQEVLDQDADITETL